MGLLLPRENTRPHVADLENMLAFLLPRLPIGTTASILISSDNS